MLRYCINNLNYLGKQDMGCLPKINKIKISFLFELPKNDPLILLMSHNFYIWRKLMTYSSQKVRTKQSNYKFKNWYRAKKFKIVC